MAGDTEELRPRSRRLTRAWLVVALMGWAALTSLVVVSKTRSEVEWRYVESAAGVLAGGFAALVVGMLLFDRIKASIAAQVELERRADEERAWLRAGFPLAVLTQHAMRHLLSLAADELYDAVAVTGALPAVIPADVIRWDAQRLPAAPPDLASQPLERALSAMLEALAGHLEDGERADWTGPMAVARIQLDFLHSALAEVVDAERSPHLPSVMGEESKLNTAWDMHVGGGIRVPLPQVQRDALDDQALRSLAVCPEAGAADRLAEWASRMEGMARYVAGPRDFDPEPLHRKILVFQVRCERLRRMARASRWETRISSGGETSTGDLLAPLASDARKRVADISGLWAALIGVRTEVFRATGKLMEVAAAIGTDPALPDLHPLLSALPQDGVLQEFGSWDLWRRRHGLYFEAAPRPAAGPASAVPQSGV